MRAFFYSRTVLSLVAAVVAALCVGSAVQFAVACPFCSAPSQTLAEQVAQSDGVCLVQWVSAVAAKEQDSGSSTYDVLQVVKSPKGSLKKGERVTLARFRAGKPGDLFLLLGTKAGKGDALDWGSPTEITEPAFNYVAQAPTPEMPTAKRLGYFVRFLEFPDQMVSNDAYAEFANAPYKDIAAVAQLLPHDKLRKWIGSADTPQTRLGLYGLLLGLCGEEKDAKVLADKIAEKTDNFRIGIDGMISGYLLLMGPAGLEKIDDWKFKDRTVPFSETYAAMMGLRFMWQYAGGRIPNERLMYSMRLLLDRPELADLVIADLARWNDWSVQERLMGIYGKDSFKIPSIKRAIVRYMLASTKAKPVAGQQTAQVDFAKRGKQYLEELRQKDPKTVKEAERFFFVN